MKEAILKIVTTVIIMVIILWILIFKTPVGKFFANAGVELETISRESLRAMGALVFINLATIFGILGYIVSGQKGKNRLQWTLLCIIFNFWAFLILTFLPYESKNKTNII